MGKRTGRPRGRPPGVKGWDKERQRQKLRELFFRHQDELVEAQIANARGIKYLVAREKKTGKFVEVTQEQVKAILTGHDDTLEMLDVWEKQPSVQAFSDLANRALDKPIEQVNAEVTANVVYTWKAEE